MKKLFFRLGVTMELTQEEFALICTSSNAAHDLLRDKVARNHSYDLDVLDMICNHPNEINLENCCYTEEEWEVHHCG